MSEIQNLALLIAAHNHIAVEGTEQDSLRVYLALKAQADADRDPRINEPDNRADKPIPSKRDDLMVHELVAIIDREAVLLAAFGERVLEAAHSGLLDAVEGVGFEIDATRWCFKSFAETGLAKEAL